MKEKEKNILAETGKKHFSKKEENNTLNKGINILAKTKKRTFSTNKACKITQSRD